MKIILSLLLSLYSIFPAIAQTTTDGLEQQYREAGIQDAAALKMAYDKLHKPLYQQAYDDYLEDLDYIAEHGTAPDNEALYHDILLMNSDEPFVYSRNEADQHQFFNNVYQNYD